jgi:hypothetical protein
LYEDHPAHEVPDESRRRDYNAEFSKHDCSQLQCSPYCVIVRILLAGSFVSPALHVL